MQFRAPIWHFKFAQCVQLLLALRSILNVNCLARIFCDLPRRGGVGTLVELPPLLEAGLQNQLIKYLTACQEIKYGWTGQNILLERNGNRRVTAIKLHITRQLFELRVCDLRTSAQ